MVDALTLILGVMLIAVALGLGSTLTTKNFHECVTKKKRAILIGFGCQFGIMPLIAYSLSLALDLKDTIAIGLILTGSAPGGVTSNLITYWSKGNVALSITMSVASTMAALGALPLLIVIYIETTFETEGLEIPFSSIFATLAILIAPCLFGIWVRTRSDEWAKRLEKGGSITGGVFLVAALIYGAIDNEDLFDSAFKVWFASGSLQLFGTFFGYTLARLAKLSHRDCRTIAIETGIQNSTLVIALIGISYDDTPERDEILTAPLLYSLCYVVHSAWITALFRFVLAPRDEPEEVLEAEKEDAAFEAAEHHNGADDDDEPKKGVELADTAGATSSMASVEDKTAAV